MKLFGKVLDATGSPVSDAVVTVKAAGEDQTVITDSDGAFSVEAFVGQGGALAHVEKEGMIPKNATLSLNGIATEIRLKRDGDNPLPVVIGRAGMKFGEAIEVLKVGGRVARSGWNGKGMWLGLQRPDANSKMGLPYIYMSTVDGKLVPWLASQTDVLAEDWDGVPMPAGG